MLLYIEFGVFDLSISTTTSIATVCLTKSKLGIFKLHVKWKLAEVGYALSTALTVGDACLINL